MITKRYSKVHKKIPRSYDRLVGSTTKLRDTSPVVDGTVVIRKNFSKLLLIINVSFNLQNTQRYYLITRSGSIDEFTGG